ncbi:hypothetical protein [Mongoliibacter ruber]|uniref:hypothetical protein n=1 Tax=Mongoliibacter ruber TaxID=1750599 RepID=UPI001475F320|nr:hypothetical protein [Mongoliibacter ruber]
MAHLLVDLYSVFLVSRFFSPEILGDKLSSFLLALAYSLFSIQTFGVLETPKVNITPY